MTLDRVTITGADDSIEPEELLALSLQFPWVEWGLLLSAKMEGQPRFPSLNWMLALLSHNKNDSMTLSGHLCGRWVRELCLGDTSFIKDRLSLFAPEWNSMVKGFDRIQLNFHADPHAFNASKMMEALRFWERQQYIIQFDDVNNKILYRLNEQGVPVVPLFDTSGGAGIEPEEWPASFRPYCGYAGGLHPEKIQKQIERISEAAGEGRIWVDIETHVRSDDDKKFDLEKVKLFLNNIQPWVSIPR